ncbi:MAG: hypothetical protein CMH56_10045 [Myxococcales bacterium]|nr:hypothetical protein [Myxococcales bacterium]|tara:strand:+ start:1231 stop:1779 length:549 start_codon:yes stop_codon:yes gene_type:complete
MEDKPLLVAPRIVPEFDELQSRSLELLKTGYPIKSDGVSISSQTKSSFLSVHDRSLLALGAARLNSIWKTNQSGAGSGLTQFYLCCFSPNHREFFFCDTPAQRTDGHLVYKGFWNITGGSDEPPPTWGTLEQFMNQPAKNHAVFVDPAFEIKNGLTASHVAVDNYWYYYFEGHYIESVRDVT